MNIRYFVILLTTLFFQIKSNAQGGSLNLLVCQDLVANSNTVIPGTTNQFSIGNKFTSLIAAHTYLKSLFTSGNFGEQNVTIYVRGGKYFHEGMDWEVSTHRDGYFMKITNYEDEEVIFDGTDLNENNLHLRFMTLHKTTPVHRRTNLWIEGLIIQNYVNGPSMGHKIIDEKTCTVSSRLQNSHNIIKNNVFRNIGDLNTNEAKVYGFSAIGLSNSCDNRIESNVFYEIENKKKEKNGRAIHAMYITNY